MKENNKDELDYIYQTKRKNGYKEFDEVYNDEIEEEEISDNKGKPKSKLKF